METQKATTKEITEGLKPIKEGIEKIPKVITFPAYPSIQTSEKPIEGEDTQYIGEVAVEYLKKFTTKNEADRTFGLYDKNGNFYIGDKHVVIVDNNTFVDGEVYEGTPGLWDLIVSEKPSHFTEEDFLNYGNLLIKTNAIQVNNDSNNPNPKSSKSDKWKKIIRPIWGEQKKRRKKHQEDPIYSKGLGLVVLSGDPNALLERLDLLLASQEAGHTGVRNELVGICDELKRMQVINANEYKKLNSVIKKL